MSSACFLVVAALAGGDPLDEPAGDTGCERAPATLEAARRRSRTPAYAPPSATDIERAEKLLALLLAPVVEGGNAAAGKVLAQAGDLGSPA